MTRDFCTAIFLACRLDRGASRAVISVVERALAIGADVKAVNTVAGGVTARRAVRTGARQVGHTTTVAGLRAFGGNLLGLIRIGLNGIKTRLASASSSTVLNVDVKASGVLVAPFTGELVVKPCPSPDLKKQLV